MKQRMFAIAGWLCLVLLLNSFRKTERPPVDSIAGSWRLEKGSSQQVLIFQDGYFSHTVFDKTNKTFTSSYGGIYKVNGNTLKLQVEFDTRSKESIGKDLSYSSAVTGNQLLTDISGTQESWKRIDEGKDKLAGVWRITGRMVDGKIQSMQRGDRKTLKLLSGTRFQWMAINPATKEFFGTGGGTYSFQEGKYTEYIEFFSRDSSRVGASLTFDGSVTGDVWNHSGKSSKGEPLNELWTREKYE